jgi:hypothetical protein
MENEHSTEPRVKDDVRLTWYSHVNRLESNGYGWREGTIFREDHDIFRLMQDGNVIAVRLCARFPGWHIYAKTGYLLFGVGAPGR